jgi:hypothetical protein
MAHGETLNVGCGKTRIRSALSTAAAPAALYQGRMWKRATALCPSVSLPAEKVGGSPADHVGRWYIALDVHAVVSGAADLGSARCEGCRVGTDCAG